MDRCACQFPLGSIACCQVFPCCAIPLLEPVVICIPCYVSAISVIHVGQAICLWELQPDFGISAVVNSGKVYKHIVPYFKICAWIGRPQAEFALDEEAVRWSGES